jgi:hypothetical protein
LNVCPVTENKTDDPKDNFYEELERVFGKFLQYFTKILLGDFSVKVGRDVFKPGGNKCLREISNDNGVNFATSKDLILESAMCFHIVKFIRSTKF